MGRRCVVHKHREDVPIEVHHVWPSSAGGPDTADNKVPLCANAHSACHDLLQKVVRAGKWTGVPWSVRRRYGWRVRRLAKRGFDAIQAAESSKPRTVTY